jgi:hypothetical protein
MKPIKTSVINTFNRVGIPYKELDNLVKNREVANWVTMESCIVTPLIKACVLWVYTKQLAYEKGDMGCRQDDFDRVRYFILEQDADAYSTCID